MTDLTEEKKAIEALLVKKLGDKFFYRVSPYEVFSKYLAIEIAASKKPIYNVRGQYPQHISFSLSDKLILQPRMFGGSGGRTYQRNPNLNNPDEKYLCMKSVTLPFRNPNPNIQNIIKCLDKFIDSYIQALKDNIDVLCYQDIVNYQDLLSTF